MIVNGTDMDTVCGTLVTRSGRAGIYRNPNDFILEDFDFKNASGESTLKNYDVKYDSTIQIRYELFTYEIEKYEGDTFSTDQDGLTVVTRDYDGDYYVPHIIVTNENASHAMITYSLNGSFYAPSVSIKNAGTYSVYFEIVCSRFETLRGKYTVVINKVKATIEVEQEKQYIYTGKPVQIDYTVYPEMENLDIEITYNYDNRNVEKPNNILMLAAPIKVGKYCANITLGDTQNHEGFTEKVYFEIIPGDATVSINESYKTLVYTSYPVAYPTFTSYIANPVASYVFEAWVNDEWVECDRPTNVGKYRVTVHVAATESYDASEGTMEFEVIPAQISVQWSEQSFVYNGSVQHPTAIATGFNRVNVEVDYKLATDGILAGDQTITISSLNENYEIINDSLDYEIAKKTIMIEEMDKHYVSDGSVWSMIYTNDNVEGIASTDKLYATLATVSSDLGLYINFLTDFVWTLSIVDSETETIDMSQNYDFNFNVYIHIKEKPILFEFKDLVVGYNGEEQSPTLVLTTEDVRVTYIYEDEELEGTPSFIKAGSYTLGFILEKEGYDTVEDKIIFVIEKIDSDVEISIESKEFDGKDVHKFNSNATNTRSDNSTHSYYTIAKGTPSVPTIEIIKSDIPTETLNNINGMFKPGISTSPLYDTNDIVTYNEYFIIKYINRDTNEELEMAPVEAGHYSMIVVMFESENYLETEFRKDFDITKQLSHFDKEQIEVNENDEVLQVELDYVKGLNAQYGAQFEYLEYQMVGVGNVNIVYYDENMQTLGTIKPENAGNYIARFFVEESDNYANNVIDVPFTIFQRQFVLQSTEEVFTKEYDGMPWQMSLDSSVFKLGAIQSVFFEGEEAEIKVLPVNNVTITGTISTTAGDFGTYLANEQFIFEDVAMFIDGRKVDIRNYTLGVYGFKVEIDKAPADFNVVEETKIAVYDGLPHMFEFDFSRVEGNMHVRYSFTGGRDASKYTEYLQITEAGSYDIYYCIEFDNYAVAYGMATMTIERAETSIELVKTTSRYSGSNVAFGIQDFTTNSDGTITYKFYDLDHNELEENPVNRGIYLLEIIVEETNNYEGKSITVNFEITPALVYVTWSNAILEFNNMVQMPMISTSVSSEELGLTMAVTQGDGKSIGTHTATVTIANPNYYIEEDNRSSEYEIAPIVVEFVDEITVYYT
ncbi:MAG: hypothetical protein K2G50_02520, partial [Anaeroplasmataceae bacterium]|nr:hypothetical protein [Anaeroplasmataceae bacterium]